MEDVEFSSNAGIGGRIVGTPSGKKQERLLTPCDPLPSGASFWPQLRNLFGVQLLQAWKRQR